MTDKKFMVFDTVTETWDEPSSYIFVHLFEEEIKEINADEDKKWKHVKELGDDKFMFSADINARQWRLSPELFS